MAVSRVLDTRARGKMMMVLMAWKSMKRRLVDSSKREMQETMVDRWFWCKDRGSVVTIPEGMTDGGKWKIG